MSSPKKMNRRTMLQLGFGATAGTVTGNMALAGSQAECNLSPSQVMGPFYPIHEQDEKDTDMTLLKGHSERAKGEVIWVRGQILDEDCNPIPDVLVEVWQANANGRYTHEGDKNPAPLDPNFQSWGQCTTDAQGAYGFKTIKPAPYPLGFLDDGEADEDAGYRTPHIHFRVARRGYHELVTQCYFPGETLNAKDGPLNNLSEDEQARLMVVPQAGKQNVFGFNLSLRKVNPASVDKAILATYVGKYQLKLRKETHTYSVSLSGTQLYLEVNEFFPKVEIRPLGSGRFSYSARSDGKEISFQAKKSGKVTALTIHQKNGKDQNLKKIS